MLYDITAVIAYDYQTPAGAGRNLARLMPATVPGEQRLVAGTLCADPVPDERIQRTDFFGNAMVEMSFREATRATSFRVQARVERTSEPPGLDLSPPMQRLPDEIAAVHSLAPEAPHHFLGPSPRVRLRDEMTEYACDHLAPGMTALAAVEAIGRALHRDMRFDAAATTVDTDPAEAFAKRHGVCQDFTHVMIACLRGVGIPAGYVSGYLRTLPPPGQERLAGADAMHAWVRAWVGRETGWIAFDPTNDAMVGADHIRVAVGRDYDDVAPLRGVLRTGGGQTSSQKVDVVPLEGAVSGQPSG
ncbi:transglutaminase family protein [Acidimangrovimonas sediminis]|uniref:transglutaminase family protein n=1 Tax=Acidimangrovimonas sediminis TaxID=2056283 RepID=UPI000C809DF7|nr:transglutaminase family protein [Acidimangrovimonas sediminis]